MIPFPERGWRPSPQQLAAYADGELGPAEEMWVEEWLFAHPGDAAEIESLRHLARWCRQTRPPDPTNLEWSQAERRVRVLAERCQAVRWCRLADARFRRPAAALVSVAAALLVIMLVQGRFHPRPRPPAVEANPSIPADLDEYPVVSGSDFDIVRMNPADRGALLVDDDLLAEPIVVTSQKDVTVHNLPARLGRMPQAYPSANAPDITLIVAPLPGRSP